MGGKRRWERLEPRRVPVRLEDISPQGGKVGREVTGETPQDRAKRERRRLREQYERYPQYFPKVPESWKK